MIDLFVTIGISVAAFAVLLAFIVFIHEYGHFKVARLCGVRVDTFSIGFGPALISWTDKHNTEWKIASIPLGGYVKFFGDANAASAGASAEDDEEERPITTQFNSEKDRLASLLTEEEKRVCFHFKPVWQRMAVVAAGPMANFVLGAVIFAVLLGTVGTRDIEPVVGYVSPGTPAEAAGFEPGDRIVSLNGRTLRDFQKLQNRVRISSDSDLTFAVERDGRELELVAAPRRVDLVDGFGNDVRGGQLGIERYIEPRIGVFGDDSPAQTAGLMTGDLILSVDGQPIFTWYDISRIVRSRPGETVAIVAEREGQQRRFEVTIRSFDVENAEGETVQVGALLFAPRSTPLRQLNPVDAITAGTAQVGEVVTTSLRFLGRLVTFQEDPRQLGGPVKIAKYAGQAVQSGFDPAYELTLGERILASLQTFINLAAVISVSIGFMNLLPIPVLDGGHLVYYAYEAIAGRPLSDRVQGIGFRIGLAIVGTFMIFVIFNDVAGLF
ncbi:MAG: RIP metalloprotease RseP [Pseudomonadota bacterium]